MKILKITLENINSLKGKFEIDLEDLCKGQAGIFAITGPTGSGKTSILDGICTALYGRTPRLPKPGQMEELMTHRTAQCMAEVVFSINNQTYRSYYERHRAHQKLDGNFRDAKMELIDVDNDKIVATKSKVPLTIEKLTGLDFDRFCKSILLAQGNFSAFLMAKPPDRAVLLEKITGTRIYALISEKTFEKNRIEREKLEKIRNELAANQLLTIEEIDEIHEQIDNLKSTIRPLNKEQTQLLEIKAFFSDLEKHEKIDKACQQDLGKLEEKQQKAALELEKLNRAQLAVPFLQDFEKYTQTKNSCAATGQKTALLEKTINQNEKELNTALKEQQTHKTEYDQFESKYKTFIEAMGDIGKNLPLITEKSKQLIEIEEKIRSSDKKIKTWSSELKKLDSRIKTENKTLNIFSKAIDSLDTELSGAVKDQDELLDGNSIEEAEQKLKNLENDLAEFSMVHEAVKKISQITNDEISVKKSLEKAGETLQKLEPEIDAQQRKLETLMQARDIEIKIQSLEAKRQELVRGEPCPLCGSREHPWVENKGFTPSDSTRKIDQTRQSLSNLLKTKDKEKKAFIESQKNLEYLGQRLNEQILVRDQSGKAKDYGSDPDPLENHISKLKKDIGHSRDLINRLKKNNQHILSLTREKHEKKEKQAEIKLLLSQAESLEKLTREKTSKEEQIINELEQSGKLQKKEIEKLIIDLQKIAHKSSLEIKISGENFNSLEHEITALKTKNTEKKDQLAKTLADLDTAITTKKTVIAQKKEDLKENCKTLEELQKNEETLYQDFNDKILKAGFENLDAFQKSILPHETLKKLESVKRDLQDEKTRITALKQNNEKTLKDLLRHPFKQNDPLVIDSKKKELERKINSIHEARAGHEYRLKENDKKKKAHEKILEREQQQIKELEKWEYLNNLIGQKDGGKFRMFAQDLTLANLINYANTYLSLFNKRYMLEKSAESELEIMIIDTFFGDKIRTVENLSGGESFLVSLSLALGLSDITSRRTNIESLFLDEGFGTLDAETLETALAAIDTLNASGKTVGIISHIETLKERIYNKIEIRPLSDGTSRINIVQS